MEIQRRQVENQSLPKAYAALSAVPLSKVEDRRRELLDWWTRFIAHQQLRVRGVIEAFFVRVDEKGT
jgi:hypothetical protein